MTSMKSWTYWIPCLLHALIYMLLWEKIRVTRPPAQWLKSDDIQQPQMQMNDLRYPAHQTKSEDNWNNCLEAYEIHSEQRSSRQDVHSIKRHFRQKSQRSFGIRYVVFLILALSLLLLILMSWTSILLTTRKGYWEPIHLHQNVWKTTSPLSQIMVTTCYYVQSSLRR